MLQIHTTDKLLLEFHLQSMGTKEEKSITIIFRAQVSLRTTLRRNKWRRWPSSKRRVLYLKSISYSIFLNRKIFNFNLFELWLLSYFLCQRIILKGYRLAKRDLMFVTLEYISSHLVWLKKMAQIQIIVLKLLPRLTSFLSTNILSPSLFQLNPIQSF